MAEHIRNGDWVIKQPLGFQGTAEDVDAHGLRIPLDPDHGHFTNAVYASLSEVRLVREQEIADAEYTLQSEQEDAVRIGLQIEALEAARAGIEARITAARAALQKARSTPRRSPHAEEVA